MTGLEVKAWREARGMSQGQLAGLLPMAVRTLQAWERGRGTPPPFMGRALNDLEREQRGHPLVIQPISGPSPWSDPNPPDFPEPSMVKMHVPYHGERRQEPVVDKPETHELVVVPIED